MAADTTASQALAQLVQGGQLGTLGAGSLSVPMPFENRIVLHESIRVAGTTHVADIDKVVGSMAEEETLTCRREPHNRADQWAIRLESKGHKVGYIPADCSELLARLMDGGKVLEAVVLDREKRGNWWRIHVEVSLFD